MSRLPPPRSYIKSCRPYSQVQASQTTVAPSIFAADRISLARANASLVTGRQSHMMGIAIIFAAGQLARQASNKLFAEFSTLVEPSLRPPATITMSGFTPRLLAYWACCKNVLPPEPGMLYPLPPEAKLYSVQPIDCASRVLHRWDGLEARSPSVYESPIKRQEPPYRARLVSEPARLIKAAKPLSCKFPDVAAKEAASSLHFFVLAAAVVTASATCAGKTSRVLSMLSAIAWN